jgi:uracil-DNA glycosylase
MTDSALQNLLTQIRACTHCAAHLPHGPRPIVQASGSARILIVGQAPGTKVHASGIPWDDDSGNRLREWMGIGKPIFYDPSRIALMPMGFCYPGKGENGDLPPRPECAPLWHEQLRALLPQIKLTLLVGQYAQARYLPAKPKRSMTEAIRAYADAPDGLFPLPHPSWRSTLWMRKNSWFEAEVIPTLRAAINAVIEGHTHHSTARQS